MQPIRRNVVAIAPTRPDPPSTPIATGASAAASAATGTPINSATHSACGPTAPARSRSPAPWSRATWAVTP